MSRRILLIISLLTCLVLLVSGSFHLWSTTSFRRPTVAESAQVDEPLPELEFDSYPVSNIEERDVQYFPVDERSYAIDENLTLPKQLQILEEYRLTREAELSIPSIASQTIAGIKPSSQNENATNHQADTPLPLPQTEAANPIAKSEKPSLKEQRKAAILQELPQATAEEREIWLETLQEMSPDAIRDLLRARNSLGPLLVPRVENLPEQSLQLEANLPHTPTMASPNVFVGPQSVPYDGLQQMAATSCIALDRARHLLLNNVANANSNGFKRTEVYFGEFSETTLAELNKSDDGDEPPSISLGMGSYITEARLDMSHGELKKTGRELDLAIDGLGFFPITVGKRTCYTRNGSFQIDEEGVLVYFVSGQEYPVEPTITLPADYKKVRISAEGEVSVSQSESHEYMPIGNLQLANFVSPTRLKQLGGGLFAATARAGHIVLETPGENNSVQIKQGYLEQSNVNIESELKTLKQYRQQYKAIQEIARGFEIAPDATLMQRPTTSPQPDFSNLHPRSTQNIPRIIDLR